VGSREPGCKGTSHQRGGPGPPGHTGVRTPGRGDGAWQTRARGTELHIAVRRQGTPARHSKRVTLEDTAEQARVSAKTASNVMGQRPARPTLLPAELQDVHRVQ
jgi:hypothetical protein